jgi:hypothetical protein
LFEKFQQVDLSLFHLNYKTIVLVPKKENAVQIHRYIPIYLVNLSFKTFTKVGTNRVTKVAHTVIRPTRTAFTLDRYILEGVLILHDTIHELHWKKMDGVLLKPILKSFMIK